MLKRRLASHLSIYLYLSIYLVKTRVERKTRYLILHYFPFYPPMSIIIINMFRYLISIHISIYLHNLTISTNQSRYLISIQLFLSIKPINLSIYLIYNSIYPPLPPSDLNAYLRNGIRIASRMLEIASNNPL